jgi:deazaflavin-dependent oxidoreductase (nitroreductase family)
LEFGGIDGIIGAERRQHETAIQHVPFSLGLGIHFRERLRFLSVRTCGVSLVAWTCCCQPIAFKLTHLPIFTENGDFYEATMDSNALTRLKAVAGRQTLTLTHYGRKSGKPHDVTIWFAVEGDKVYIGTANVNRQWVRNVQKTPRIRLAVGGETFEGEESFLAERAERERAMAAIRRKYWMYRPLIALRQILTAIGVMRDKSGAFEVTLAE